MAIPGFFTSQISLLVQGAHISENISGKKRLVEDEKCPGNEAAVSEIAE